MKTLLDIDNDLMEKLLQSAGTRVKKEAVDTAIAFLSIQNQAPLLQRDRHFDRIAKVTALKLL